MLRAAPPHSRAGVRRGLAAGPPARIVAAPRMEALVILIVPLVALFVWALARFSAQPVDPAADRAQREQHIAWLEERLAYARVKNWDEQMIGNLTAQLEAARRQQLATQRG